MKSSALANFILSLERFSLLPPSHCVDSLTIVFIVVDYISQL